MNDTFLRSPFVTAMIKGGTNGFATKGGDATGTETGGSLNLMFNGTRPARYQPMHKTGAIILGVGGDNLNANVDTNTGKRRGGEGQGKGKGDGAPGVTIPGMSIGTFYEGQCVFRERRERGSEPSDH